jgi:hypothetical protein
METTATTTGVLEKRMRAIALLAEDINEMFTENSLSVEQKYNETVYFLNEMLRNASGLADQEEEIMTYEWWK